MPRVVILTDIPTPVRDPLWARLASEGEFRIRVLYCAPCERGRSWSMDWTLPPDHEILAAKVWVRRGDPRGTKWNPSVRDRLEEAGPDVVLIGGWGHPTMWAATAWCRSRGVPYVLFTESHLLNPRPAWKRALKRILAGWMTRGAAAGLPAGSAARDCLVHYGADPERCFPFPYTPDAEEIADRARSLEPRRAVLRAGFSFPPDEEVALFVGRLAPEKGIDVLLRAFAEARQRLPRARLWIVGEGPLRAALEEDALRLGLAEAVRFHPALQPDRLPEVYVAADLLCLPSRREMWGAVVNEAMACGRPVVASRMVGAAHDLLSTETGRVVPAEDPTALARAIEEILSLGPAERTRMGEAARRRALASGYPLCMASFRRAVRVALEGRA